MSYRQEIVGGYFLLARPVGLYTLEICTMQVTNSLNESVSLLYGLHHTSNKGS